MKLEQTFKVEAPIEKVWEALIDVERVAPCLPGAEITESDESGVYKGNFTVKLGPTTAAYRGELHMESVDEAARTVTMRASGQDKRGQGGAKATIVSVMREDGGATAVDTTTDFTITGRLARFGRGGMIKDISNKLLKDFSACLAENIEAPAADDGTPAREIGEPEPAQAQTAATPAPPPGPMRPAQPVKPVNGLALFLSALWSRIRRLFGRG
ncbi:MAG TPA: SRPBCC family protein [Thermoleophilaceae bacterium]|nr:SRPBCC family protein [Thermoleophilaceae bacterium]